MTSAVHAVNVYTAGGLWGMTCNCERNELWLTVVLKRSVRPRVRAFLADFKKCAKMRQNTNLRQLKSPSWWHFNFRDIKFWISQHCESSANCFIGCLDDADLYVIVLLQRRLRQRRHCGMCTACVQVCLVSAASRRAPVSHRTSSI